MLLTSLLERLREKWQFVGKLYISTDFNQLDIYLELIYVYIISQLVHK